MTPPGANEDEQSHDPPHWTASTPAYPASSLAYPASHAQDALPTAELEREGHDAQLPDPAEALYVPASHAAHDPPSSSVKPASHAMHDPEVQLAVKPSYLWESSDVNRTRRCCPVAAYVASAGVPLSVASSTTPDEHAASPHSSTYT